MMPLDPSLKLCAVLGMMCTDVGVDYISPRSRSLESSVVLYLLAQRTENEKQRGRKQIADVWSHPGSVTLVLA